MGVSKGVGEVYTYTDEKDGDVFGILAVQEWPQGGFFSCLSSHGNFENAYWDVGDQGFKQYLCGLSYDEFMGSTQSDSLDGRVFSPKATVNLMLDHLAKATKKGLLTKDREWHYKSEFSHKQLLQQKDEAIFKDRLSTTDYYIDILGCRLTSIELVQKPCKRCSTFWQEVWLPIRQVILKEITERPAFDSMMKGKRP